MTGFTLWVDRQRGYRYPGAMNANQHNRPPVGLLAVIGPGLVVAATGVGAGDLLTASFVGSALGTVVLWAALMGAVLKWSLNEGIARWQLATGTTLLEGWARHLGRPLEVFFLVYLLVWSIVVGGALAAACGVGASALIPLGEPAVSKGIWAAIHSALGVVLVWRGGFALLERMMAIFVSLMVVTVLGTAWMVRPDLAELLRGSMIPVMPVGGRPLVLGLIGGVGGTVTLMCYGYWIRESQRQGLPGIRTCRIDLAVAYLLTAIFGMAMVVIGSQVEFHAEGAQAATVLADLLANNLGETSRYVFLFGFWGAVFSSLLGVWQGVPYLFADFVRIFRRQPLGDTPLEKTPAYRGYLLFIAVGSLASLGVGVRKLQLVNAVLGAAFMPLVALTLLLLNNRPALVGQEFRNGWRVNLLLVVTLGLFAYTALAELTEWLAAQEP